MDNTNAMVRDTVARLLADTVTPARTVAAEALGMDGEAWSALGQLGLRADDGDVGLDAKLVVLQEIGRAGALVPYAESEVLGRWLAAAAGISSGEDTLTVSAVSVDGTREPGGSATLHVADCVVPWGRHAAKVLLPCRIEGANHVAELEPAALQLRHEANMAGEPRDVVQARTVRVSAARLRPVGDGVDAPMLVALGALCRTASMAGALARTNDMALQYAQDRTQFGKPISQFQVIQSYLAEMAGEVAAASAAFELAAGGAIAGSGWGDVAVAKVRAGQAARVVTRLSHQIHGAIGMTHEYPLQVWTRRLWAWREEFGAEEYWAAELGRFLVSSDEDQFWPHLTEDALAMDLAGSMR